MSQKLPPPFFWVKNHESFWFSFLILSRKNVSGSQLHGVCMGRSGTSAYALAYALQFMHFSAIFFMLTVLATLVTPCYPLRGW